MPRALTQVKYSTLLAILLVAALITAWRIDQGSPDLEAANGGGRELLEVVVRITAGERETVQNGAAYVSANLYLPAGGLAGDTKLVSLDELEDGGVEVTLVINTSVLNVDSYLKYVATRTSSVPMPTLTISVTAYNEDGEECMVSRAISTYDYILENGLAKDERDAALKVAEDPLLLLKAGKLKVEVNLDHCIKVEFKARNGLGASNR